MKEDKDIIGRLLRLLEEGGVSKLSAEQSANLEAFVGEVVLWSGKIHLLGKRDLRRTLENQVLDSFMLLEHAERSGTLPREKRIRVADVGSGAGFPGVIWKIARPAFEITLFERKRKPFLFLERVIALLGMEGLEAIGGDAAKDGRRSYYDIVISKAAGRLGDMLPVARRLLGPGGAYVTVKGAGWEKEALGAGQEAIPLEASIEFPGGRGSMLIFRENAN